MNPVAISLGPLTITWYSICILLGVILAGIVINNEAKRYNIPTSFVTNLIFWCVIFGLLGAMLYFGYFYRIYLGNTITSQILPVILINLLIGFSSSSIDNFAHIGGLVGGIIITMALGVKDKADKNSRLKGIIFTTVIFLFLIYMNFIYVK